jgi:mannose-6-phosphate isomerase-like protein (cupin superfamily)
METCGCREFLLGYAELDPGMMLPLHTHAHAQCNYILSGAVWSRRGPRRIELGPDSADFISGGVPHSYEVIGSEPLRYVYTYACEVLGTDVETTLSSEAEAALFDRVNISETRWAVADDFEPWKYWEPSKGSKGMRWKTLFDENHGNHPEMNYGTMKVPENVRYSRHFHDQPEIFFTIAGRGVMFSGEDTMEVKPGCAIYVPKRRIHGAQNTRKETLRQIWVYGTEQESPEWSWDPVEDIFLEAQS